MSTNISDLFSTLNLTSSTIERKFNELLAQLEEKDKKIEQLETVLANNKSELEENKKQIENLVKQKVGAESENQQIQIVKEKLEQDNETLKNEVKELNEKVKQLELEAASLHMRESDDIQPEFLNFDQTSEENEEDEETEEEQNKKTRSKTLQEDEDDDDILVDTSDKSKSKPNEFQSSSQKNTPNKESKKRGPKPSLEKSLPPFPTAKQLRKNYIKMDWAYDSAEKEKPFWTIIEDKVFHFCNKQGGRDQLKLKRSDNTTYSPTTNTTRKRVIEYYTNEKKE